MTMKFKNFFGLVLGLVMSLGAMNSDAGFIVTIDPPVTSAGFSEYTVRAFNTGGTTGTLLQAFDATVTTPGTTTSTALRVNFQDFDGDGANDANIIGQLLSFGTTDGTFMKLGNLSTTDFVAPSPYETDPSSTGSPTQALNPAFFNLHSLNVVRDLPGGGVVANTGKGAQFTNIVVPTGVPFTFTGQLGADKGPPISFSVTTVPEPAFSGGIFGVAIAICFLRSPRYSRILPAH